MDEHRFDGRAAIVTGGGSGIGRAAALALAPEGARVLAVGRRPQPIAEVASRHRGIEAHAADLTDPDAAAEVIENAVGRFGRLDVLVNNAAAMARTPLPGFEARPCPCDPGHQRHRPGPARQGRPPASPATRGTIINVSRVYGHRPAPRISFYAASKAALESLTRSWALEVARTVVRVNAVAPGRPTPGRSPHPGSLRPKSEPSPTARWRCSRWGAAAGPKKSHAGSCTSPTPPPHG